MKGNGNGINQHEITFPTRLYHVRRVNRLTRCVQLPIDIKSLNDGDTFILDVGSTVFTWFGKESSPFEKSKAAEMAQNIVLTRIGFATKLVQEVGDYNASDNSNDSDSNNANFPNTQEKHRTSTVLWPHVCASLHNGHDFSKLAQTCNWCELAYGDGGRVLL